MSWIEEPAQEIYNFTDGAITIVYNLSTLLIDEYFVIINNELSENVLMTADNDECYNCPSEPVGLFGPGHSEKKFSSKYFKKWSFQSNPNFTCDITPNEVGELGVFKVNIPSCTIDTFVDPVNIGLPILVLFLIYLAAGLALFGCAFLYNKYYKKEEHDAPEVKNPRIKSLDTFRGISIILMILVNYGGGQYNFLEHATWNGLTLADVVFPWFLWIMGVCIPISIKSALKRGDKHIYWHIMKRSIILFMLGILYNGIDSYWTGEVYQTNIYNLRIFGVLQRFAVCYSIVATVCLIFMKKDFPETPGVFQDITMMLPQWICALLCVAIHTAVTFGLEIPDCPVIGYLGPGGIQGESNMSNYGDFTNCSGGAVGYVDRKVLGEALMYRGGAFKTMYHSTEPVDPEGIIGTFNAVLQVFLGVQAGMTLLMYKGHVGRVTRWLIWAAVTGIIGGGLCGFSRDNGVIPINKILWSLSFVLVTSFFAFVLLSILYIIIDGKELWGGKPFLFAGMNPIILYMGQGLTFGRFPFQWGLLIPSMHFQMLAQAMWGTMCWWLVSYWLYKIKFFLSI